MKTELEREPLGAIELDPLGSSMGYRHIYTRHQAHVDRNAPELYLDFQADVNVPEGKEFLMHDIAYMLEPDIDENRNLLWNGDEPGPVIFGSIPTDSTSSFGRMQMKWDDNEFIETETLRRNNVINPHCYSAVLAKWVLRRQWKKRGKLVILESWIGISIGSSLPITILACGTTKRPYERWLYVIPTSKKLGVNSACVRVMFTTSSNELEHIKDLWNQRQVAWQLFGVDLRTSPLYESRYAIEEQGVGTEPIITRVKDGMKMYPDEMEDVELSSPPMRQVVDERILEQKEARDELVTVDLTCDYIPCNTFDNELQARVEDIEQEVQNISAGQDEMEMMGNNPAVTEEVELGKRKHDGMEEPKLGMPMKTNRTFKRRLILAKKGVSGPPDN